MTPTLTLPRKRGREGERNSWLGAGAGLVVVADLVGRQDGRVDRDFVETAVEECRGLVLADLQPGGVQGRVECGWIWRLRPEIVAVDVDLEIAHARSGVVGDHEVMPGPVGQWRAAGEGDDRPGAGLRFDRRAVDVDAEVLVRDAGRPVSH